MVTAIEDKLLEQELQELYVQGKNWVSELIFLNKDLSVLKANYAKTFLPPIDVCEDADEILQMILRVENVVQEVRDRAVVHLQFIDRLIMHSNSDYNLSLLEDHVKIEIELKDILLSFKAIKQMVIRLLPDNKK